MQKVITKKYMIIAVMAVIFTILSVLVFDWASAYLTDADETTKTLKYATNKIALVENFNPPSTLKLGVTFTKDVKVKNDDGCDCFVRIKAVYSDSDMGNLCTTDFNTTDYVYNASDNFWYLKTALKSGETSPSLFTTVKIATEYDYDGNGTISADEKLTEDDMKDFEIYVYAESCQQGNFEDDEYEAAWAYFLRNMK